MSACAMLRPAGRVSSRRSRPLGLLLCGLALILGGCVTVPPPTVSVEEIGSYRLAGLELRGVEVIRSWPAQEQAYLASGKADPDVARRLPNESASNFPALQAQFLSALQQEFTGKFNDQVAPILHGTRSVKALVTLSLFDVPSGARQALIDDEAKLRATILLTDAKTGAVLVDYPGPIRSKTIGGNILAHGVIGAVASAAVTSMMQREDPGQALIAEYIADYHAWLVTR